MIGPLTPYLSGLPNQQFNKPEAPPDKPVPPPAPAPAADDPGPPASAPVGIPVQPGTNPPGTVGDTPVSGHGFDRMQERWLPPSVVTETIQNGQAAAGKKPDTTTHYDEKNNVTAVTDDASGKVISARKGNP